MGLNGSTGQVEFCRPRYPREAQIATDCRLPIRPKMAEPPEPLSMIVSPVGRYSLSLVPSVSPYLG